MTESDGILSGTPMHDALGLAGFALVHAAWSLEDGPGLVPIGLSREGERVDAQRFVVDVTAETLPGLRAMVGAKVGEGRHGVLAFESGVRTAEGQVLGVINAQLVDQRGELVATVRQAFQPAERSRIPGRSKAFAVVGTPVPSDEIDLPGAREAILIGAMSHPQGARLFPELAGFAREMIAAAQAPGGS